MTRSVKKRGRLTEQPRLTAFLQPANAVMAAEVGSRGGTRSNGTSANRLPAAVGGCSGSGHSGPRRNRVCLHSQISNEQVPGPLPENMGALSTSVVCELVAGSSVLTQKRYHVSGVYRSNELECDDANDVFGRDNDTDLITDWVRQSGQPSNALYGLDDLGRQTFSSKCSLDAFVKRRRVDSSRGQNLKEASAPVGRAVDGSAYAQCPVCTLHIPLTRMNHHLDIECEHRCLETMKPAPPTDSQLFQQSKMKPPARADTSLEDKRLTLSDSNINTSSKEFQDTPDGADVSRGTSKGSRCVDAHSMGSDGEGAQLGAGVFDGAFIHGSSVEGGHEGRAGKAVSGCGFGANKGFNGGTDFNDRGMPEEQVGEGVGEFEVMPTLDAWLPGAIANSQRPVHGDGDAWQDSWCEQESGRLAGSEEGEGMGDSMSKTLRNFEHVQAAGGMNFGQEQTAEANAVRFEQSQRVSNLTHTSALPSSKAPHHDATIPTSSGPNQSDNLSLADSVRAPDQLQGGPVSSQLTASPNHTRKGIIYTPTSPRGAPVNALLGMIRERGQRPLFGLSWAAIQMRQPSAPKGHYLVENFLTEEEEAHILASLDADVSNPWMTSRVFGDVNEGKAYGLVTDLRKRTISKPKRPMPPFLQTVLARIRTVAPSLSNFAPNECNAINYLREEGHWLRAHVDDRQLSGTIIAGISLNSDCVMTYEKERGRPQKFRVRLPRRCLQVQTQDSRYNYTHSIKNADLLGDRRVSITFRQVAEPQS